uniref:FAS1 domain-containing protein n=1 Tax=Ananas comosus var. bracteatus TaxID=296719 RepID=A0A6V7P531_ANACO|nr:unnamed protein product [Ananas comosus var. bracteatus]
MAATTSAAAAVLPSPPSSPPPLGPAAAHNITEILAPFSDFSNFNNLLSQSKVADEINRRQTITVLVVDNSAAGAFSSLQADVLNRALSVHVILDYYDPYKFERLKSKTALLTTLYQASGVAANRMGFLNYTERTDDERMLFGSAEPGAPLTAELVKVVAARPYNISVLQVTAAIIPPGIDGSRTLVSPPPPPPAAHSPKKAAAPAPEEASEASAPAPDAADKSDAPAPADGPVGDAPLSSPPAPAAVADAPARGLTRLRTTLRRPGGWPLVPALEL